MHLNNINKKKFVGDGNGHWGGWNSDESLFLDWKRWLNHCFQ